MVLKLYGVAHWSCAERVLLILREKNIPFEFHEIDWKDKEHKSPAFLEKQPYGRVPYLDDDGFILYESRAISQYIVNKYADKGTQGLIPTELKANAIFLQALSSELCNFEAAAFPIISGVLYKRLYGIIVDQAAIDAAIIQLDAVVDVYEKILGKQRFLAGDELTLADLFHIPSAALLPASGYNGLQSKPNVARWWKEISSRPSWQATKGPHAQ